MRMIIDDDVLTCPDMLGKCFKYLMTEAHNIDTLLSLAPYLPIVPVLKQSKEGNQNPNMASQGLNS